VSSEVLSVAKNLESERGRMAREQRNLSMAKNLESER
jgi:hypothetical protein